MQHRNWLSQTQDSGAEHYENAKILKRNNRTGSSSDVGSIYHHSWEQKIVSNALGSYAEKDRYNEEDKFQFEYAYIF